MRYLSICSGIEAATAAWHPLGWEPAAFAEIDAFPSAVLKHHYPSVPNLGDFTRIEAGDVGAIDLLVGGTPCQSFSVAGLRGGLADDRGNLALEYLRLAQRTRPQWLVWENVPGVLSSNGGRDFGAILGGMVELGYGFAYRVLDAQYIRVDGFGRAVPQRRRRVFVVGCLGDWRRAAAVLFERESLCGNPAPSRQAGQGAAPTLAARTRGGGGLGTDFDCDGGLVAATLEATAGRSRGAGTPPSMMVAHTLSAARGQAAAHDHALETHIPVGHTLNAKGGAGRMDFETETLVAHSLRGGGFDDVAGTLLNAGRAAGSATIQDAYADLLLPIAFDETQITSGENRCNPQPGDPCHPIPAHGRAPAIAHSICLGSDPLFNEEVAMPQTTRNGDPGVVQYGWQVRRLTPLECERLQGFEDGYTDVSYRGRNRTPDGPRYKALGNSMAVNVMRWIGHRIETVSASTRHLPAMTVPTVEQTHAFA